MVQSTGTRFFLTEKELLQLQLHLCAGNGTFENTNRILHAVTPTFSRHKADVYLTAVRDKSGVTYSLCPSLCSSAAAVAAPISVSPVLRVSAAPVSSSAPTPAAVLLPAAPVVAYTNTGMVMKSFRLWQLTQ